MINIFKAEIERALLLEVESERLTYLTSVLRSILQTASITSLEIVKQLTPDDSSLADSHIQRFRQPSDGLPIEIIDLVAPHIRAFVSGTFARGWFEKEKAPARLVDELVEWVAFRNKKTGHGVLSQSDIAEWAPKTASLCNRSLSVLKDALPITRESKTQSLAPEYSNLEIETPLIFQGKAIVITKISSKKSIWKLQGQTLCWERSTDFIADLPDNSALCSHTENGDKFRFAEINTSESRHTLFHNVPIRQTATFEGRKKELERLKEWLEGDEEPNTCLVYGDGGYGKTTLALEFLNRFLEGEIELKGKLPEIVSYHTAKMTKWTDQGLINFRGISTAMEDSVRSLMFCFQDVLEKDWYTMDGQALIDKVKTELVRQGYNRDDVLLILDNTETLANSPADVEELSDFFEKAAKRIGRIIITSRRREYMAAKGIHVSSLSENESVRLLQRLGEEYNADAIIRAGEARLRKVSGVLSRKPLLMDALVRHIARACVGIDEALANIFSKSNDELLEFLYLDAWVRMTESQRKVYLILVQISVPTNSFSIGCACQQVKIPHGDFHSSLDETYFASLTDYGRHYEIEIVDLARNFFHQKLAELPSVERDVVKEWAKEVDDKVARKEEIEKEYKEDRVAEAFRGQFAKAAKLATSRGQLSEAKDFYDIAIQDEPLNAALHDRYAWFALNKLHDPQLSLQLATKSLELNPHSADALVTLALTHYHLNDIESGDISIASANREGKPLSLCLLRMGIARYHSAKKSTDKKKALQLFEAGIELFGRARRELKSDDNYYAKNISDLDRYTSLTQKAIHLNKRSSATNFYSFNSRPLNSGPLG